MSNVVCCILLSDHFLSTPSRWQVPKSLAVDQCWSTALRSHAVALVSQSIQASWLSSESCAIRGSTGLSQKLEPYCQLDKQKICFSTPLKSFLHYSAIIPYSTYLWKNDRQVVFHESKSGVQRLCLLKIDLLQFFSEETLEKIKLLDTLRWIRMPWEGVV